MRKTVFASLLVLGSAATLPQATHAGEAENRIVGLCAAQSGGQPAIFAACAAKDLSLAEIKKCFDGTGCFGPGNTLVQFNDWFNRTILGTCGAFHSQAAKEPKFLVMNNSSLAVRFTAVSERTNRTAFSLLPGQTALLSFAMCDTWVNIDGTGVIFGYDTGGVMEFAAGADGVVHQYLVIGK